MHISTDCVFSGRRGHYAESDTPDPLDLYGRSKLLGEVERPGAITLRTSIIGWEVMGNASLLEWFAAQRGRTIRGFRRAIYSGLATADLAETIATILLDHAGLHGLFQIASEPIDKYTLLTQLRDALAWSDIRIDPDDELVVDRSLSMGRFSTATGWRPPTWPSMIHRLAEEWPTYSAWRST